MKKSMVVSFGIVALAFGINIITAIVGEHPVLAINLSGGEHDSWRGFGVVKEFFYSLTTTQTDRGVRSSIHVDFLSLLVWYVVIFIIVYIATRMVKQVHKKKREEN